MSKLAINGAQLQCTLGAKSANLVVTSHCFFEVDDKPVATEKDIQPMANVPSFGNCKCNWMQPPCVPAPQAWQDTTEKQTVNGSKCLTQDSFCMCSKGGKISFVDAGKNTFVDVQ